ncbi:type II secretion system inner membrane protein GspF [Marinibactrum halimedae]|uniref:General secretion pathway protein F n=1 Tax=Marinibactrum halimedae TaxID=1444977 RepID=A0AA37T8W1_9GAMM|nr:type II secretion system inner membrane protein GspF [Marinibactrum halimedae]MCD9458255.1 type II secretion system inner membrane protein GspF [Marinibactrum halimedae]GLS27118.1 type II secretion system protein F [Marinibactrum halimedae]
MGAYSYTAINSSGKTVKGIIEGDSERQVRSQLRGKQLKPLTVSSARDGGKQKATQSSSTEGGLFGLGGLSLFAPKVTSKERSLLTRQLASLISSGLPLDESLNTAAKQANKPATQSVLFSIRSRVLEGHSLAQAFSEHPKSFDNMYRSMIRAGESSGYLGEILEQLAEYIERSEQARGKLKMAMIYPIVLLCVSIAVVTVLMVFVVPDLVGMFQQNERELPGITVFLIAFSDILTSYGLFILMGLAAAVSGFQYLLRKPSRLRAWHRFCLRVPLIKDVILLADSSRFAGTLSLLIHSGVPLLQALRISTQVLGNSELQSACSDVTRTVQEGGSLNKALRQVGWFPPLLVQMAASGEANGTLDHQLKHCAQNQERELEMTLATTLGIFEPLIVVFMGGAIAFIMLAILMPIFDMNKMV